MGKNIMNYDGFTDLLGKAKSIIEKYDLVDKETGNNFNIFNVCEIGNRELMICRFIYQLINPEGLHNQGDIFLRKFISNSLSNCIKYDILNDNIKVYKEYVIANDRRIDLLIETDKYIIPIEVKVYAGDQGKQCEDYMQWAKKQGKDYALLYLTLDGHFPSEQSIDYIKKYIDKYDSDEEIKNELSAKNIYCISFKNEIIKWLKECIMDISIINKNRIKENLVQFFNIVEGLCNMGNDNRNIEMEEILKNKENFNSYLAMKQCEKNLTSGILKRIIRDLNNWGRDNNFILDDIYSKYEHEVDQFCAGARIGNNLPGFGIICDNNKYNCKLCVCIEINSEDYLYYGVYIKEKEKQNKEQSILIQKDLDMDGKSNESWPFWDSIKINDNVIGFKNPGQGFSELLDEKQYNKLLEDIKCKLSDLLVKLSNK